MTATDSQVRIIMRERNKGRTQEQAAASANLRSRKTVAKYETLGKLPSELKWPRAYRTRPDSFVEDWPAVEEMLSLSDWATPHISAACSHLARSASSTDGGLGAGAPTG